MDQNFVTFFFRGGRDLWQLCKGERASTSAKFSVTYFVDGSQRGLALGFCFILKTRIIRILCVTSSVTRGSRDISTEIASLIAGEAANSIQARSSVHQWTDTYLPMDLIHEHQCLVELPTAPPAIVTLSSSIPDCNSVNGLALSPHHEFGISYRLNSMLLHTLSFKRKLETHLLSAAYLQL